MEYQDQIQGLQMLESSQITCARLKSCFPRHLNKPPTRLIEVLYLRNRTRWSAYCSDAAAAAHHRDMSSIASCAISDVL